MSQAAELDPYTAKATNDDVTPQEKIRDLHKIVKGAAAGMLTTRSADGSLHSRAMTPASPHDETQLTLYFIANNVTHKFDEIDNDANVNVSFYDSTTSWASYSAKARVSRDQGLIKKHWSSSVSAYFGDLKDGVHKGNEHDPRISVIEVIPSEIHYWLSTQSTATRAINATVSAATGRTSAPGELRTITRAEIQLAEGLHTK